MLKEIPVKGEASVLHMFLHSGFTTFGALAKPESISFVFIRGLRHLNCLILSSFEALKRGFTKNTTLSKMVVEFLTHSE